MRDLHDAYTADDIPHAVECIQDIDVFFFA